MNANARTAVRSREPENHDGTLTSFASRLIRKPVVITGLTLWVVGLYCLYATSPITLSNAQEVWVPFECFGFN